MKNEKQPAAQNLSVILYFKPRSRKHGVIVDYKNPSICIPMASELSSNLSAQAQRVTAIEAQS